MGVVIPFRRKTDPPVTSDDVMITLSQMTAQELHTLLAENTLQSCRNLLQLYKRTGRWTPECETSMTTAVIALKDVCRRLAETAYDPNPENLS